MCWISYMTEQSQLAEYQDALIELLSQGLSPAEIMAKLKSDPRFENFEAYVTEFDPDMVAVASELMGKWAKYRGDDSA